MTNLEYLKHYGGCGRKGKTTIMIKKQKGKSTRTSVNRKSRKSLKSKADKLWREAVKARAGNHCEVCKGNDYRKWIKKSTVLHAHHLYSRKFMSTRFGMDNGVSLCPACHFWAHQSPLEFHRWLVGERGEEAITDLIRRKNTPVKVDLEHIIAGLEEILKESVK
jgi:hypothetical protein